MWTCTANLQARFSMLPAVLAASILLSGAATGQETRDTEDSSAEPSAMLDGDEQFALGAELTPVDQAERLALERPSKRRFSLYLGIDFATKYVSRGLIFSDRFSYQPWVELNVTLTNDGFQFGPVDRISWFVGNWNSFDDGAEDLGLVRTGGFAETEEWYEADIYTGFRFRMWEHFQASLRFNWYTSPSGAFEQIQELDLRLSYDDRGFWTERFGWEGFATTPSLRVAKETLDSAGPEQWYIQPSVTPSYTVSQLPFNPRIKVPFVFGFGANGQYQEFASGDKRHFGFFQTGVGADVPLNEKGTLTLSGGIDVVILADSDLATCDVEPELSEDTGLDDLLNAASGQGDDTIEPEETAATELVPVAEGLSFCQEQVEVVGRFGLSYSF